MTTLIKSAATVVAAILVGAVTSCASGGGASDGELVGLFRFSPGVAHGAELTGTWFRMLQPGGTVADGPYMANHNSSADEGRATLLQPGTSGGLRTGAYQSEPSPSFGANGDSFADAVIAPTKFFAVRFGVSTNQSDPQTRTAVAPPKVSAHNGKLTADLSAWAVSWNGQEFNQGAPKPVSSTGAVAPGQQAAGRAWDWVANKWLDVPPQAKVTGTGATGTIDGNRHFVLTWTSHIDGGPFNGFTGIWHLEGVFEPTAAQPSAAAEQPGQGSR
ncbi:hypothetical protein HUN08_04410 [Gordonia sp. X0973]|uniref:hypothetical protein n=1 Tax=Gordonia sp. X0973 TaxID=2742602 RepID=UPI000F53D728|nr:hypothetical protein [Gordonia sp. X0973]QKT06515.1 hypothetical protein HUN08_04410 [Gordonia sp. X0973]